MQILIVEDEARVSRFIARGLSAEGHRCVEVDAVPAAWEQLRHAECDLVILDRMLRDQDGIDFCRALRAQGIDLPVLMLTALDAVDERVDGLRAGADDYLGKPFDFEELIARVESLGRRRERPSEAESLQAGAVRLDSRARRAWSGDTELELTALEFDLLRTLVTHQGAALSRERILSAVWGQTEDPLTNIVDVYIGRLRRKLAAAGGGALIETVRGVGYRLG
ncbi:response regulator transcription factor [Algiphilus sp.]|uniref:response regulator transcription factor n=1 Tax=Algiphilus sp. TaxID=1872431 RepID=UPI003C49CFB3